MVGTGFAGGIHQSEFSQGGIAHIARFVAILLASQNAAHLYKAVVFVGLIRAATMVASQSPFMCAFKIARAPCRVVPSSKRPVATLSSRTLLASEAVAPALPAIFDIFDAPVRLGESSKQLGRSKVEEPVLLSPSATQAGRQSSMGIYSALGNPTTLPPPIIFDGPARPRHLLSDASKKPRQVLRGSLLDKNKFSTLSSSESEILCEIFDGPSRLTRYKYPAVPNEPSSSYLRIAFTLCLSGTFGWMISQE